MRKVINILIVMSCFIPSCMNAQTYESLWKQVKEAEQKSLPKTAVDLTRRIYNKAEKEKNSPQMLLAFTRQMGYKEAINPDSFYTSVQQMEMMAERTANPVDRSVVQSLLAGIYAQYAHDNQWQLRQRTDITGELPADIREWGGNNFIDTVLKKVSLSMNDSLRLLEISSKTYIPFVQTGETSEYFDHTMYHLLAQRNIAALTAISRLDKDSTVVSKIGSIYENLIRIYKQRDNTDAYILTEIDRLNWKLNSGSQVRPMPRSSHSTDRNSWYVAALDELIRQYGNREIVAEAYLQKAQYLMRISKYGEALVVANRAIDLFPRYNRINAIRNVRTNILRPEVRVSVAGMAYPNHAYDIRINHRNVDEVSVELYRVNLPASSPVLRNSFNDEFIRQHTTKLSSNTLKVERPFDYLSKDTVLNLTAPAEGLYLMRCVSPGSETRQTYQLFSVTRFKLLTQRLPNDKVGIIALDAISGNPVGGVSINIFENRRGANTLSVSPTTGADGKVIVSWKDNYQYVTAIKGNDSFMTLQSIQGGYYYYNTENPTNRQMSLLTDRAIYRPGQTVYVKGIVYDVQNLEAEVVKNEKYTLTLTDSNGREISKQEMTTNDFGSFTGELVLPSGGLNGMYMLGTELAAQTIRVEEYKRPTFDISFAPVDGTYRLNDKVTVTGSINTYSGVPVADVPAHYTVTRRERNWWGLWRGENTVIASGTVDLDNNGEFRLPVNLLPDTRNSNTDGFYTYVIDVTVTNIAGETQSSAVSVAAGTRSVLLNTDMEERINKDDTIKATFIATNLSDRPVEITGRYILYRYTDYVKRIADTQPAFTGTFSSNKETLLTDWSSLPSAGYKLVLSAQDDQGRDASFEKDIVLFSIDDKRPAVPSDVWYYPIQTQFNSLQPAEFLFGTSKKDTYVLLDVFYKDQRLESRMIHMSDTIIRFEYPYKEEYGDGLSVSFRYVKDNEVYSQDIRLEKKLPDNKLILSWEVFRDKLLPGSAEQWKLTIRHADGSPVNAELLAMMYDASLDKIWKLTQDLSVYFNHNLPSSGWSVPYLPMNYFHIRYKLSSLKYPVLQYDKFDLPMGGWKQYARIELVSDDTILDEVVTVRGFGAKKTLSRSVNATGSVLDVAFESELVSVENSGEAVLPEASGDIRTNFSETAFFYPQLRTNESGEVVITFTMPESLTRWNFRGYAHTQDMKTGMIVGETVTSKDFMISPNLPRFVRVGDRTSVAASVTNLTGKKLSGTVTMTLFDPLTDKVISTQKEKFTTEAGKPAGVEFSFTATDRYELLGCRIVAEGGKFSDGEQHILPVLSNKEYMVETVAMPIRGGESREFSLEALFNNHSKTASNQRLTVEFTGNPIWYAVQSLPTLSMPDNDNAVSWATAYYANSLSSFIVNSYPRIQSVLEAWRVSGETKETMVSNLLKNKEVMDILLEESPWLAEAESETEQMRRIALLFDLNTVRNNNISALNKLTDLQLADGSWPWYKGMDGSRYITEYVVETLTRLANITGTPLTGEILDMRNKGLGFIYNAIVNEYESLRKQEKEGHKVTTIPYSALRSLYIMSLTGETVPANVKTARQYFLGKLPQSIFGLSVTDKAMAAVVLNKSGRSADAQSFVSSLKEHLTRTDEQGAFFDFNTNPYSWTDLRIPAHVTVMEALELTGGNNALVEDMKVWLLKQKQTQQWDSPVSTANAVYALLFTGGEWSMTGGNVEITLGSRVVDTTGANSIPGIGYVKEVITDQSVIDKSRAAIIRKSDAGIGWGAIYAQYLEDIDKVSGQGGELNVEKNLFVERMVNNVKQLDPVSTGTVLNVGDVVVSRITIRLDRAMDFVQLKDQRGACFEPIDNLSGYRWGAGTGYYVAVKDASTNFFFDSLQKGVYVLEHRYRTSRNGTYEGGLAIMQSAYAPEFSGHSASVKVNIANR